VKKLVKILLLATPIVFVLGVIAILLINKEIEKNGIIYLGDRPVIPTAIPTPAFFTGMDLWQEVNKYRESKGVKPFNLNEELCNGIVDRWEYIYNNGHKDENLLHAGLNEFARKQISSGKWKHIGAGGELVAGIDLTASDTVNGWAGSPSHYQQLTSTTKTEGCAYSFHGISLLLVASKK